MKDLSTKDIIKLSEHVYFINGCNRGRYPYSNSLFIKGDKRIFIDSGVCLKVLERFKNKIDIVLYSHWHEDHISFNQLFKTKYIHILDKDAAEDSEVFCSRYPFPIEDCQKLIEYFMLKFSKESFLEFEDNEIFKTGKVEIHTIHTPGHTIGHTSFLVRDNVDILFLSDIDLSTFGPWYGGIDSDVNQFIDSIKKLMKVIDEYEIGIGISSHTGIHRNREKLLSKLERYLNIIYDREEKVRRHSEEGYNLENMIGKGIVYREIPKDKEYRYYAERRMIELHIERINRQI